MADIALEANLTVDDSALEGASKLFGYLWNSAWEHGHGTASGDAEDLHDMRVNLRRLRTAMESFEGPKMAPVLSSHLRAEIKEERKRIGMLGDKLGAVRDHDVLLEYLEEYARKRLKADISALPGLASLERYLQTERASSFAPMVKRINRSLEPGALRESFGRWALGLPASSGAPISLLAVARLLVPRRLDEIEVLVPALQPGAEPEAQHELRKSLRRMRYTLETLSVCFEQPVKPLVKTLVGLQDLLGEMQDRAVLAETTHRAFGDNLPEDVLAFNEHGEHRRRYLLGQVRRRWTECEANGFLEEMRALAP